MEFGLWAHHFSIHQRLAVRMDLPQRREPLLDFFDRLRRAFPAFERMHRDDRLHVLESARTGGESMLVGVLDTELWSAHAQPPTDEGPYRLHQTVLEIAPFYLSITPIDVESLELTYAFQFEVEGNRDEIVAEALLANSPLRTMVEAVPSASHSRGQRLLDCQPFASFEIDRARGIHALMEVRTRAGDEVGDESAGPILVDFSVRRTGSVRKIEELPGALELLSHYGEELVADRLIPRVLHPLRETIASASG